MPSRLAMQLALAHLIERAVEKDVVNDYAAVARALGVSRARVSQLRALLGLAPKIQEKVMLGEVRTAARALRVVAAVPSWERQIQLVHQTDLNENDD